MRTIPLLSVCLLFITSAWGSDDALIKEVDAYLSSITKMEANFIQMSPEKKVDKGTIYIERPNHIRLNYKTSPISLIVKGDVLTYYDRELDQKSQILTSKTAASLVTGGILSIISDSTELLSIKEENGFIYARIQAKKAKDDGEFTLAFTQNPMSIKQIIVRDVSTGQKYMVTLENINYNPSFKDDLFKTTSLKKR